MQNLVLTPDGQALEPMPGFRRTSPDNVLYKPFVGFDNLGTQATDTITFGGQPTATETMTIIDGVRTDTYEFYANGGDPTSVGAGNIAVEIGADASGTADNFVAAMLASSRVALTGGNAAGVVTLTADNPGTGAHAIVTDVSALTNVSGGGALTGGVDATFAYSWYDLEGDIPAAHSAITNSYLVVSVPASAFLVSGGVGICVVDQITNRLVSMAFHPGGDESDPVNVLTDRPPKILWHLNRQAAHDYPKLVGHQNLTEINSPWDEIAAYDGNVVRKIGVRAPQFAPIPSITSQTGDDNAKTIAEGSQQASWVDATDRTNLAWEDGTNGHLNVEIQPSDRTVGELGYFNTGGAGDFVVPANTVAIRIHCWFESERTGNDGYLPEGTFSVVVSDASATGKITLNADHLDFALPAMTENRTFSITLPWTGGASYTIESIGLDLQKKIPDDHFTSLTGTSHEWNMRFLVEYVAGDEATFMEAGEYLVAFSWYNPLLLLESNLSPFAEQRFAANSMFSIDLAGWYEGIVAGMENSPPRNGGVTRARVYLHNRVWGADEWHRPVFRLFAEIDVSIRDKDGARWVRLTEEADVQDVLAGPAPSYDKAVPMGSVAALVDGDRMLRGNLPSYSVGEVFILPSTFETDDTNNVVWDQRKWENGFYTIWCQVDPGGRSFTWNAANGLWSDGSFIAHSDEWQTAWVTVTPTDDYTESVADRPQFGPWMERREIRFASDSDRYWIRKVAWNETLARYDKLYVERTSTSGAVVGTTGVAWSKTKYEVIGEPRNIYYSTILAQGVYPEGVGHANVRSVDLSADEILVLGHVGEFIYAAGRRATGFMRQDKLVVDNIIGEGDPFPRVRISQGGTASPRGIVQTDDQVAFSISADGKLLAFTANGIENVPVSNSFKGFITSQYRVKTGMLRNAHAVYDRVNNRVIVFLADTGVGPTGTDTTDKFGDWPDAPPLGDHVDWEE